MTTRVTIEDLGAKGEGVARAPQGRIGVPYTLPGETVTVDCEGDRGTLIGLLKASPQRVDPICSYFGRCGGCAMQMMALLPYAAWKRGLLVAALERAGLKVEVAPLVEAHGPGRRRATLHARRRDDGRMEVGFMQARAHTIVAIDHCPILDLRLAPAVSAARAIATALAALGKPLDILATLTDAGIDIDLRGAGPLGAAERQALVAVALKSNLARLSNHGVIVVERRRPTLRMGSALLEPPPGAFLQATEAGEAALGARVVTALAGARRVADLFCGIGTFALRLATQADVVAFDMEKNALDALTKASHAAPLRAVQASRRDLFGQPLRANELAPFDAVVLDPPRAGAEAQVRALAESSVPLIVSVACDVESFARDAAILVAAGYRLETVEPIDQFLYSPHVEIVAVLRRAKTRKPRRLLG